MFDTESFEFPPGSFDELDLSEEDRALVEVPDAPSRLPPAFAEMAPGPGLAAFLSVLDVRRLTGYDRVVALRAHQRMASHYESRVLEDVAAIGEVYHEAVGGDYEEANRATVMELRAALRLTRRSAEMKVELADAVVSRIPALADAMADGSIDVARARVIAHGTIHLSEGEARSVSDTLLADAPRLTTGQLAALVRRLCMAAQPASAKMRFEHAVDRRRLVREATVDGTANVLILDAAPDAAAEALSRIDHIARSLRTSGETRTLDQLRTDVAIDLLTGRARHQGTGRINLHVDLRTLAELSEEPGELAGYGPVVADIARQIAGRDTRSEWRYLVTDPATGMPVHVGTTQRYANAEQRRYVELRDPTCVFPGCLTPADECDLDHIDPWESTHTTTVLSLAPGCRPDHVGRHRYGWVYRPLPGGDYLWTSPLGHRYTTSGRSPPLSA